MPSTELFPLVYDELRRLAAQPAGRAPVRQVGRRRDLDGDLAAELHVAGALERDIVREVADHILLSLTPQDERRLSRVRSVDPDVHESYLKGRYYWNKRTQASLATAVEHFRAAIAADPTYAPAHVGLADCYNQLGTVMVASGSRSEMRPRAIAAALAALQIDPMLGEAHGALAYARHYDWQWRPPGAHSSVRSNSIPATRSFTSGMRTTWYRCSGWTKPWPTPDRRKWAANQRPRSQRTGPRRP